MVLVNACCKTFTALSQGELACASAGAARARTANETRHTRNEWNRRHILFELILMKTSK
jgi:hypothetical protein